MKLLYGEPEVNNHLFAIYYPHYKKNNPIDAMTKISPNLVLEKIILTNKGTIRLKR